MHKLQIFVSKFQRTFRVGLLRNPRHRTDLVVDQEQDGVILTGPLPSSKAYEALGLWESRFGGRWRFLWWHMFARRGSGDSALRVPPLHGKDSSDAVLSRLKEVLDGRLLSEQRLVHTLRQEGFWPSDISQALDVGVHQGELKQFPGFINGPWGRKICTRCQGEEAKKAPCLVCGSDDCILCSACRSMGEHRSCSTLLTLAKRGWQGEFAEPESSIKLQLDYELTTSQEQASRELLGFWEHGEGKALVWAACGAGKTEVTFAMIQKALRAGGQVLFAIPRQDIVREMTERLRLAFPGVTVASHYGGKPWFAPGELVVATTHHVLHFYERFDLAILDEVDAFPYQGNEMLRLGLKRALLPQGKLVEMTATPYTRRGYERVITIPARYHGFSLPEPELLEATLPPWETLASADFPPVLFQMLQSHGQPWLIFAPTIAACSRLRDAMAEALAKPVGLCHSKVENRSKVVQDLKDGRLDIVVTTSVLERGVNFPGVGVIVLYAEHAVFTVNALVQIAGRVGRTAKSPHGTVLFIGSRITRPMKKALELIQHLNQEARERGLLYSETTT